MEHIVETDFSSFINVCKNFLTKGTNGRLLSSPSTLNDGKIWAPLTINPFSPSLKVGHRFNSFVRIWNGGSITVGPITRVSNLHWRFSLRYYSFLSGIYLS